MNGRKVCYCEVSFNLYLQIPVQAVEMPGSMTDNLDVQVSFFFIFFLLSLSVFNTTYKSQKCVLLDLWCA